MLNSKGNTGSGAPCRWINLVAFAGLMLCGEISAAPHLGIAQPNWNFGVVTNQEQLTHDFVISNTGDVPLEITRLLSSCSACLEVDMKHTILAPGATAPIHSRLDLRQMNGDVARAIFLDCNDPDNPSVVLELSGTVVQAFQITPDIVTLDLTQGRQSVPIEIEPLIKLHSNLSRIVCANTNLEATITTNSFGYELTMQPKKSLPYGDAMVQVVVSSADTNDLTCRVVFSIHNPPDLELIPAILDFRAQTDPQTRILWIKQHGPAPLALLDVIPPSDKFHCEIDPDPDGVDYRVYVYTGSLPVPVTNTLTLKMQDFHGEKKSFSVPMEVAAP